MKLSNSLISYAKYWLTGIGWNSKASDHVKIINEFYRTDNNNERAYLCLLEAEYQKDIESYQEELAVHL